MTEEELIRSLNNPDEFKRLIKNSYDLTETAKQFPDYDVFQSASVDEALNKVIKLIEINKVKELSKNLGEVSRTPGAHFFNLPNELLIEIAKKAAKKDVVSENDLNKAAHEVFNKPKNKK